MKKFLPFLASLLLASVSWGQTGNGVILLTDASYTFTPTTVDSSSTFNLQLKNTVGIAQTVFFGGLDAPFVLSNNDPIEVASQDTIDFSITFTPSAIGSFSDTLEVIGNVFGSASLVVSGDGIQVQLEWAPDTLAFEVTPIGQTSLQELSLQSVGDGAATISNISFSNDIFALVDSLSDFSIPEGGEGILTAAFNPVGAGTFEETMTFETNDPNNSVVTIVLTATSISEVSGETCDAVWSLADSPFTLVGDIYVPEGCTLEIESGVLVDMGGYSIDIDGEFICAGTADAPITVQGGVIHLGPGAPSLIQYLEYEGYGETQDVESPYAMVYYNNFGSSSGQYDFDCFDYPNNSYYTGTNTGSGSGCASFYRDNSSSWSLQSNSDDYYLNFYSNSGGDGYLYLDDTPIATTTGEYDISFTYESSRYERSCFMTLDVHQDGQWHTIYESPKDIESNSEHTRVAKGTAFFNEGEEIQFRIFHNNGVNTSASDQMYTYIDEVRVERKRAVINEVKWDFQNNESDFNSLINSYGTFGGEPRISINDDVLRLNSWQSSICFDTDNWSVAPIVVPADGWYYIEIDNRLLQATMNTYNRWYYKSTANNNNWYYLISNETQYSDDTGAETYDWRKEITHSYQYLTAGSRIDFYYCSSYWTTYGQVLWEGRDFRIYQLTDDIGSETYPIYFDYPAGFESERDLTFNDVNGNSLTAESNLALTNSNIGTIQSGAGATTISVAESQIEDITIRSGHAEVNNSVITSVSLESQNLVDFMASESELGSVQASGSIANVSLANVLLEAGGDHGIYTSADHSEIELDHTIVRGYGTGIDMNSSGGSSTLQIDNSIISNNSGNGISSDHQAIVNYSTIADNGGTGWSAGSSYNKILRNSIITGNGANITSNSSTSGSYILSEYNYTGLSPQFSDEDYHLLSYSPAVDAAMPWHTDAHMPFGIGGLHADMGAYGGPNNAGWGGEAAPSGEVTLSGITDSPQDQGNMVGVAFSASAFDNAVIDDNVTSYAFWRHYDPTGQSIGSLDEGNWELIGEMPAQSFPGYAYQAPTLGNTNAFGTFNSCYTVVAQTDDPDTYWYSNVLCGESVDNLAPVEPELEGMVLETGGVTVFWELPSEEDYAYTEVMSDAGFTAEVTGDTLAVDLSAELGGTYTYTAVHYDVNGNASDPASLTLALEPGFDVITLNAGWNLISTDRAVTQGVDEVFAGLSPGNLQYVTGFDGGVQFYDPNGLSFLNTLGSLTPGNGYWVKVAADDVLEVSGVRLAEDFMPGLAEGWNLVGYAAEAPAAPGDVFADLEATGDLLYVTGFDQGVEVYDPNGLPFLNTLMEMRNGFGYWVKSAVATDGDVLAPLAGDVLPAEMPTPRFDVVNGVSELGAYAGEFVDVLNGWGVTVARLPILEGGHLMTTALFGDDPATGAVEGLADGEELHFAFRGAMANETLVFGGDMAHKTLSLTFDEVGVAMGVFPNPASDVATFRFQLDMDAQVELTLVDLAGREVAVLLDANKGAGAHAETLALPALEAGAYTVQLRVAGEVAGTQRLVVTH